MFVVVDFYTQIKRTGRYQYWERQRVYKIYSYCFEFNQQVNCCCLVGRDPIRRQRWSTPQYSNGVGGRGLCWPRGYLCTYSVDPLHFLVVKSSLYVATNKLEKVCVGSWGSYCPIGGIPCKNNGSEVIPSCSNKESRGGLLAHGAATAP